MSIIDLQFVQEQLQSDYKNKIDSVLSLINGTYDGYNKSKRAVYQTTLDKLEANLNFDLMNIFELANKFKIFKVNDTYYKLPNFSDVSAYEGKFQVKYNGIDITNHIQEISEAEAYLIQPSRSKWLKLKPETHRGTTWLLGGDVVSMREPIFLRF